MSEALDKLKSIVLKNWYLVAISLVLVIVIIFFLVTAKQTVTFNFVQDGLTVEQDFNFSVSVDNGKVYNGFANQGSAVLNLPRGKTIELIGLGLAKYRAERTEFSFSKTININLQRVYSSKPITLFFYRDNVEYVGKTNIFVTCNNASMKDANYVVNSSKYVLEVPENCGTLTISASAEKTKSLTTECNSTTCQIYLETQTKLDESNNVDYPIGSLIVSVTHLQEPINYAQITVYKENDMQTPVGSAQSLETGTREFNNLAIGSYKVLVTKSGFVSETKAVEIKDNKKTILEIVLDKPSLGTSTFEFKDSENNFVSGQLILRDSLQEVVYLDTAGLETLIVPVYSLSEKYYIDFSPDDKNLLPISAKEITFELNKNYTYTLPERKLFDAGKIKIQVLDQDNKPIQDAKVLIRDNLSGLDLLSFVLPLSDENGFVETELPSGMYVFRAYDGITDGQSDIISILPKESGELPLYETSVILYYGYNSFNLNVVDEFNLPLGHTDVSFYDKPRNLFLTLKSESDGKLDYSFRAGKNIYYKVERDGLLPFIGESRMIMPNEKWDANVTLEQDLENNPNFVFLGLYDSLEGMEKVSNIEIGETYYAGYDIYIYDDPEDYFEFEFSTGDEEDVNSSKFYITNVYSSAISEKRYYNLSKTEESFGKAKTVVSKWSNSSKGVYRIFYKIQVINDSSIKMSDLLKFNASLIVDNSTPLSKSNGLFVGGKSVCKEDDFCTLMTVLDIEEELYVDPAIARDYLLNPSKEYLFEYDLINGINGHDSEISSGVLNVYNGATASEEYNIVQYNISSRSFIKMRDVNLSGPFTNNNYFASTDAYGVFVPSYAFNGFYTNKAIHGKMLLTPISMTPSYINYAVVNNETQMIVRNKNAVAIEIMPSDAKDMTVEIFPEKLLIPETVQFIDVYAKENEMGIARANVTVRYRPLGSHNYLIYPGCHNIKTDNQGKATCRVSSVDTKLGTYFQVQVEKEGYKAYYHEDFKPDLKVVDKFISSNPEALKINLVYPVLDNDSIDLSLINSSASDIAIDHIDFILDDYSKNIGVFDVNAMAEYLSMHSGVELLGSTKENPEAETIIGEFFNAKINSNLAKELEDRAEIAGLIKIYFRTQGETFITYDVPFNVKLVTDNYPTNAEDCLKVLFDTKFVGSDGTVPLELPFTFVNSCSIQTSDTIYPITFEKLDVIVTVVEGSFTLGQVTSVIIPELEFTSDAMAYGVPRTIATNFDTDLTNNSYSGKVDYLPRGRLGHARYSVKVIGVVNSNGSKQRFESRQETIDVSIMDIEECVKIYNAEDEETTDLEFAKKSPDDLTRDSISFKLENICPELPIYIRFCNDNNGDNSEGCLSGVSGFDGLKFYNSELTSRNGAKLEDKMEIPFERPPIPGAYEIDVWARAEGVPEAKRIATIKVNVKTTLQSGLFSDYPFLYLEEDGNSEVLRVYNTWIGLQSGVSVMNNYLKFIGKECLVPGDICFRNFDDLMDSGPNNALVGTIAGGIAGAIGVTAAIVAATLTTTALAAMADAAAAAAAVSAGMISNAAASSLLAAGAAATIPVAGWIVAGVALAIAIGVLIAAAFSATMEEDDDDFMLYFEPSDEVILADYAYEKIPIVDRDRVLRYSSEDRFAFLSHYKAIWGETAWTEKYWKDDVTFKVMCPDDYEIYNNGIYVPTPEQSTEKAEIKEDDCGWESPSFEPDGDNKLKFKPWCGGNPFTNFSFSTYVLVPCKLRPELWSRAQHYGIDKDTYDTGTMLFRFTNIDFENCYSDWCYKTFEIKIDDSELGTKTDYYRVAFRNTEHKDVDIINKGISCKDGSGKVIGFTGEDAVPKVDYRWNLYGGNAVDENFCSENSEAMHYCDATQFFSSALLRLSKGHSELSKYNSRLACPAKPEVKQLNVDFDVKTGQELFNMSKPKVAYDSEEQRVQVGIPFAPIEIPNNMIPTIIARIVTETETQDLDCDFLTISSNQASNLIRPFCIYNIPFEIPEGEASNVLYDGPARIEISLNNTQSQIAEVEMKVTYVMEKAKCIVTRPTTQSENGKMLFIDFVQNRDDETTADLLRIQDYFHYSAYMMDDGFSEDFLNDFFNSCDERFLECPPGFDVFAKAYDENRIHIMSRYSKEERTSGPGLYDVHILVQYPSYEKGLKLDDENTEIYIYFEKVRGPEYDSMFYYMPLDGRTGINVDTVDRQGYGVDFSGEVVKLYDNEADFLMSGLQSAESSQPFATVNINTDYIFDEINKTNRGVLFYAEKSGDSININYLPEIDVYKTDMRIENERVNEAIKVFYKVIYNNTNPSADSFILNWYPKDKDAKDFTDLALSKRYPQPAEAASSQEISNSNIYQKLQYYESEVLRKSEIDLVSFVYSRNSNVELVPFGENATVNADTSKIEIKIDSLNSIFDMIREEKLCVQNETEKLSIFVNEAKYID